MKDGSESIRHARGNQCEIAADVEECHQDGGEHDADRMQAPDAGFDVNDPAWAKVDTLARHYGYN